MAESRGHAVTIDGDMDSADKRLMNLRVVKDRFGETIVFQMFEGLPYAPLYDPKILAQIKDVQMRPDDVYMPAYPRTGTHWTFEMTSMLLNGSADTIKRAKMKNMLEFINNESLNEIPSPRVIDTHMRLSHAPRDLSEKKCKMVFNIRDPKDVIVSLYNAYVDMKVFECKCSFEGYFYLFLDGYGEAGNMFDYCRDAEKFWEENPDIPVHFQIYEETMKDPIQQVKKLSDFLGLPRNDELCRSIADKCRFENMLKDKDAYSLKADGRNVLYRKGTVGDWRNWFTEEMLEEYYRVYEERMKGSRFYERYCRKHD